MSDNARGCQQQPLPGSPGGGTRGARAGGTPDGGTPDGAELPILDQVFDADSLYALRAAMAAHASEAGLSRGRTEDAVIAVHELAANAIRHGAGHGRLRLWQTGGALRCEVSDGGRGVSDEGRGASDEGGKGNGWEADGYGRPESADLARWRILPGHGLWLVRQVADQSSLQTGPLGTIAVCTFSAVTPDQALPDQAPPFSLTQQSRHGRTILTVAGALDLGSADQLSRAIVDLIGATRDARLVLDLAGLTSWDSSGLAALIMAQQRIDALPSGRMVIAGLPRHLRQRLDDAGIADRFVLADTTTQAAAVLDSAE